MPSFSYTARDLAGRQVTGVLEAASDREVTGALADRSLFPIEIRSNESAASNAAASLLSSRRRVKASTMAIFYNQLASLLRAGVPMIRALTVLSQQTSNDTLQEAIDDLRSRVEDGQPLSEAMARHPRIFSTMGCNMVHAGSEGGFLEDALDRVGTFTELQEDLKGRTVSAMAYPVFLFSIGSVVLTALLVFFVPKFEVLFERLRRQDKLPWATEALLTISNALQSYGWIALIVLVVAGLFARQQLHTDSGQRFADRWKLKIPVLGDILLNLAVARFCRVLGTLLGNGVPILKSLDIAGTAAGNRVLKDSISGAGENVRSGESLAAPLRAGGHFPGNVVEMISVGEESNSLDSVLPDIADSLEKTTFRRLDLFVRLLEPIMLLIMAVLVLGVVMALLVPVLRSSTAV